MHPAIAANQQRTFLALWPQVAPEIRRDSALPQRIKALLGRNRALGARDRRLYRELIYTALRYLPWFETLFTRDPATAATALAWLSPDLKHTQAHRTALLTGWPDTPHSLAAKAAALHTHLVTTHPGITFDPAALLPAWFRADCPAAFSAPHLDAINERAPLWLRLQCRDHRLALDEFAARGWSITRTPLLPDAVALPPSAEITDSDAYRRGFCEIQDLGSQLVLHHAQLSPGQHWLDACAGAGGKSLQLATLIGPTGHVDATDIRPAALDELRQRAIRAKLDNIHVTTQPAPSYDGILVDAPCSGTGTWRRLPHMKWYTTPGTLDQFATLQTSLLATHAPRVRPGGQLVYATCSLSHRENATVISAFLATHPHFTPAPSAGTWGSIPDERGYTILPGTHNTDGFYVAVLRRQT